MCQTVLTKAAKKHEVYPIRWLSREFGITFVELLPDNFAKLQPLDNRDMMDGLGTLSSFSLHSHIKTHVHAMYKGRFSPASIRCAPFSPQKLAAKPSVNTSTQPSSSFAPFLHAQIPRESVSVEA